MFNVELEKATYKPGDTRSEKEKTRNAGSVEDMQRQARKQPWSVRMERI